MNTQITTREVNEKILYVSQCEFCGKEFAYPYKAQTENNVLSHMKYCKYRTRNAPEPTIIQAPIELQQEIKDETKYYSDLAEKTGKDLIQTILENEELRQTLANLWQLVQTQIQELQETERKTVPQIWRIPQGEI
jgi:hypothetical protein